jgi:ubiquinone/menaquinone biosynthesis C-methylase UbiE
MKDWSTLYIEKGVVQKEPSKKVLETINFFKGKGLKKILDLGCGTGRHTTLLVKEGFEVYGCDNSEDALKIIKKFLADNEFRLCDMTKLSYEDGYFDGILCYQVIQHGKIAEIKQSISEMYRVLKKGGYLFLVVISTKHPKFKTGEEIEPNTKINTDDIDGHMPHHFFSELEMQEFFNEFEIIKLDHFEGQSEINLSNRMASWELYARRPSF